LNPNLLEKWIAAIENKLYEYINNPIDYHFDFATTLHTLAVYLQDKDYSVKDRAVKKFIEQWSETVSIDKLNVYDLANIIWAFAVLEKQPNPKLLEKISAAITEHQNNLAPKEMARSLWAFASLKITIDKALANNLTVRLKEHLSMLNPSELTEILYAITVLKITIDDDWREAFIKAAQEKRSTFLSKDLSLLNVACLSLGIKIPTVFGQ
ncbi:MAG: hypothetical protein Q8K36_05280, partial [Alphaproteobacteria bacterium]|nr:hypothetical protein [Alphaproteobacteria bacterium]